MRRPGRFAAVVFLASCFVLMFACNDEFCEECKDYICPECVCSECPESPECVCPECPEVTENPLSGEYSFQSLVLHNPEGPSTILPHTIGECIIRPDGNVSFSEEENGYRDFFAHFMIVQECPDYFEIMEEFAVLGDYTFDRQNVFVTTDDDIMWFNYDAYFDSSEYYVELENQFLETSETDVELIVLERFGNPGECSGDNRLGHCYQDENCTRNFATGCYQKSVCFELGGKGWRQCNWSNNNQTHENDGPCETS